jgi:hypothetical protein
MGKRQVRIFQTNLDKHLPELLAQPAVQVVLHNNVVLTGSLSGGDKGAFTLIDFRFGKHEFRPEEVIEIIYDVEAPY